MYNTDTQEKPESMDIRYFLGRSGWVWVLWHIVEIPEKWDNPDFYRTPEMMGASDGSVLFLQTDLFLSKDQAIGHFRANRKYYDMLGDAVTLTEI